jgi:hypothetical protein
MPRGQMTAEQKKQNRIKKEYCNLVGIETKSYPEAAMERINMLNDKIIVVETQLALLKVLQMEERKKSEKEIVASLIKDVELLSEEAQKELFDKFRLENY